MRLVAMLFAFAASLLTTGPVLAQNPCREIGPDCRLMTAAEVKAMKERVLAVKAALPVPDPARYESDGAGEASTMPFVAETGISGAVSTCRSWPAGCFTELNGLSFGYLGKAESAKAAKKPSDILAAVQTVNALFENRVTVDVWLRPHPHMMDSENGKCVDVSDPEAVNVERSATFLSWERGDDAVDLRWIFGPRTCNEADTLNVEKPAKAFAPVRSLELVISGPKAEVAALKKKLDRKAFEAFLGPVVK